MKTWRFNTFTSYGGSGCPAPIPLRRTLYTYVINQRRLLGCDDSSVRALEQMPFEDTRCRQRPFTASVLTFVWRIPHDRLGRACVTDHSLMNVGCQVWTDSPDSGFFAPPTSLDGTVLHIATVSFLPDILHPQQINFSVFQPLIYYCPTMYCT